MKKEDLIAEFFEGMGLMRRMLASKQPQSSGMPTHAQLHLLLVIAQEGPMSAKDLSDKLCTTPSAGTQLIDGLVESGLLTRDEDETDRRKIRISLTAKGKKQLNAMKKRRMEAVRTLLEPLTQEELGQLVAIQRKLIRPLRP